MAALEKPTESPVGITRPASVGEEPKGKEPRRQITPPYRLGAGKGGDHVLLHGSERAGTSPQHDLRNNDAPPVRAAGR